MVTVPFDTAAKSPGATAVPLADLNRSGKDAGQGHTDSSLSAQSRAKVVMPSGRSRMPTCPALPSNNTLIGYS